MSLIVETGTKVTNANTYITLDEYKAWLSSRGHDAPADDSAGEIEILKAMDYLQELNWAGSRVSREQPLEFPRYDLYHKDSSYNVLSDEIPKDLKDAQIEIAYRMREGFDPAEQVDRNISREQVDSLSISYANGSSDAVTIHNIPRAYRLIRHFLASSGGLCRG